MNKKSIMITAVLSLIVSITSIAQELRTLTITVINLKSEQGQAVVNLFREQDDLPKKPFRTIKSNIRDHRAILSFENLPVGSYAAIVYHDENDNGTLDHRLGFPNEPMGFSNQWELNLFSGMPTFKKLKFDHTEPDTDIQIKVD
jgi:uncharacterized protein (DUF2141 family)